MTSVDTHRAHEFVLHEARRNGLVVRGTLTTNGDEWRVPLYDVLHYRDAGCACGTVLQVVRLMDYYAVRRGWPRGLLD